MKAYLDHIIRNKTTYTIPNYKDVKRIDTLEEFKKLEDASSGIIFQKSLYFGQTHDDVYDYLRKIKKIKPSLIINSDFSLWILKVNGKVELNTANEMMYSESPKERKKIIKQLKVLNEFGIQFRLPKKHIINEGFTASDIGAILKVYRDFASGLSHREMDEAMLNRALQALKTYYGEYIEWNRKYAAHKRDELNMKVKIDYVHRYNEIANALESFDNRKKLIAIDNGINQLHIDYPVLGHMQFHIYDIEDNDPEHAEQAQKDFDELMDTLTELLRRQGKLMPEGGYAFEKEPRKVVNI